MYVHTYALCKYCQHKILKLSIEFCVKVVQLYNILAFIDSFFVIFTSPVLLACFVHGCSGNASNTKGTAFVVYEDIFDAKNACEHLSGFNVCNRYLVVLYYQPHRVSH